MTTVTTAQGHTVELAKATASRPTHTTSTVTYLHASVGVYTPSESGGAYCWHAVCTHNHPDTREGAEAMEECGDRLRRIIEGSHRLPKWAVLHTGT